MKVDENKNIARKLTDARNKCSKFHLLEVLSSDFISHISDWPHPLNRDQYIKGIEMSHKAFTKLNFSVEDIFAEGEKVVLRIMIRGIHTGDYQGIAPTNKKIKFEGMAILRIKNGKIVEEWQCNDQLGLLRQLKSDL